MKTMPETRHGPPIRVVAVAFAAIAVMIGLGVEAKDRMVAASNSVDRTDRARDPHETIGEIVSDSVNGDGGQPDSAGKSAKAPGRAKERGNSEEQASAISDIYRSLDPADGPYLDGTAETQTLELSGARGFVIDEAIQFSLGDIDASALLEQDAATTGDAPRDANSAAAAIGNNKHLHISVAAPSVSEPDGD